MDGDQAEPGSRPGELGGEIGSRSDRDRIEIGSVPLTTQVATHGALGDFRRRPCEGTVLVAIREYAKSLRVHEQRLPCPEQIGEASPALSRRGRLPSFHRCPGRGTASPPGSPSCLLRNADAFSSGALAAGCEGPVKVRALADSDARTALAACPRFGGLGSRISGAIQGDSGANGLASAYRASVRRTESRAGGLGRTCGELALEQRLSGCGDVRGRARELARRPSGRLARQNQ